MPERDRSLVTSLSLMGIGPYPSSLQVKASSEVISHAEQEARAMISSVGARTGAFVNGWRKPAGATGAYGADYLQRAPSGIVTA